MAAEKPVERLSRTVSVVQNPSVEVVVFILLEQYKDDTHISSKDMLDIVLSVLCYDIWFYVSHRILHTRLLYPIHSVHHRKIIPTILDTYDGHWFETQFQGLGALVPFAFMSCSITTALAILVILNARGLMRHDERFVWLIGNHHLLHHRVPKYNYGEYWLDRLGGTLYPNRGEAVPGLIYM
jgi:sterol desaturase/sphingolipid hydroxylase (fatty acid hydroxylase superfamily)